MAVWSVRRRRPAPRLALLGLALAFLGPPCVALASARLASLAPPLLSASLGLATLVGITVAVVALALGREGLSLAALGFGRPGLVSVLAGLALAAFFIRVFGPFVGWLYSELGQAGFAPGLAEVAPLPTWYLAPAVVLIAAIEEILYRGYALHRLTALTGRPWLAAVISTVAFALAHVPAWGWTISLSFLVSGGLLAALYLWRRDLWANILVHVLTDLVGIVLAAPGS